MEKHCKTIQHTWKITHTTVRTTVSLKLSDYKTVAKLTHVYLSSTFVAL